MSFHGAKCDGEGTLVSIKMYKAFWKPVAHAEFPELVTQLYFRAANEEW